MFLAYFKTIYIRPTINQGTITDYLIQNNLLEECVQWLKENYPKGSFYQVFTFYFVLHRYL